MLNIISFYKERLNLQDATFTLIEHDEAMVAFVYSISINNVEFIFRSTHGRSFDRSFLVESTS